MREKNGPPIVVLTYDSRTDPTHADSYERREKMIAKLLEVSPLNAVRARLRHPEVKIVPRRRARLRLRGDLDGGGRIDVGMRWPDGSFAHTELIVRAGGHCRVEDRLLMYGGSSVIVERDARLHVGDVGINNGASIVCFSEITIGNDVLVGPEVCIRDSDSHAIGGSGSPTRPIVIGDHVWIGLRAMILRGVRIGDGAVVAAGAVVSKDVEPGALVAGIPARFVRPVTWTHDVEPEMPQEPAAHAPRES
jgi:acetyltransferase-like isoleucine patch superfamily enzyme